ncbi:MAG TPA: hypothetical protein VFE23_12420 [Usitatibacter sp.]|jgi:hypothetical protein|nr:hypothetical protein [Usitatibacter sp.]
MRELAKPAMIDPGLQLDGAQCQDVAGGADALPADLGACSMTASYDALVDAASTLIERVITAAKAL